ncbi:hypothetical protein GALMADRAFT_133642 [Galerina marginata CBS 339.88]|uniref:Uncharacterized protein n=1 Tax=Galerina marginata (strain CBS 339.88) TaxID=685588 RepID=A0A067TWG0_GALM3|nr:hypothetical protein GALMADRAFT_133642 [Galerina marginata CBS 339.88]
MQLIAKLSLFVPLALALYGTGGFAAPVSANSVTAREEDFNPFAGINLKAVAQALSPLLPGVPAPVKAVAGIVSQVAPVGSDLARVAGGLASRDEEVHGM